MQHLPQSTTKQILLVFSQLGFTIEHAYVYLSNLEQGTTSASKIAKGADLPRSTTYDLLEELIEQRYITSEDEHSKTLYTTNDPNYLFERLELKKNHLMNLTHDFDKILYQLEGVYAQNQPNIPEIRYYNGSKEVYRALKKSLLADELLIIDGKTESQSDENYEWPKYIHKFLKEVQQKGLQTREILLDSTSSREYIEKVEDIEDFKIVILPASLKTPKKIQANVDKYLFDGTVAYLSHDDTSMVTISDEAIYRSEVMQFERMWNYYQSKYGVANHNEGRRGHERYLMDV